MSLPLIFSAHHASADFGEWSARVALSQEERLRYSDLGTGESVPTNGITTVRSRYSRGLIDLNRAPDAPTLFPQVDFHKPNPHTIWHHGAGPTRAEQTAWYETLYLPYHESLNEAIVDFGSDCFVIAFDNTAHYVIGKNAHGSDQIMMPIILSNNGNEGSCTGDAITCDPNILERFGTALSQNLKVAAFMHDVYFNLVYKGGYITQHYTNYKRSNVFTPGQSVQSFQIEYDLSLTHDMETLTKHPGALSRLQYCFNSAFETVFGDK